MKYLLAWRMALAKHLLRQRDPVLADIAERVGYSGDKHVQHGFQSPRGSAAGELRAQPVTAPEGFHQAD